MTDRPKDERQQLLWGIEDAQAEIAHAEAYIKHLRTKLEELGETAETS